MRWPGSSPPSSSAWTSRQAAQTGPPGSTSPRSRFRQSSTAARCRRRHTSTRSEPERAMDGELVEDERLTRLSEICLALPKVEREAMGDHAGFKIGKKLFAYFVNN